MAEVEIVEIAKIYDRKIWIEKDFFGSAHVMIQHDDGESEPFTYCSFFYDYRYTCNSSVQRAAESTAKALGATSPVEIKSRSLNSLLDAAQVPSGFTLFSISALDDVAEVMEINGMHKCPEYQRLKAMIAAAQEEKTA